MVKAKVKRAVILPESLFFANSFVKKILKHTLYF